MADLNQVLNGQLYRIRQDFLFKADLHEFLLLDQVPEKIQADQILLIGMGAPDEFTVNKMGEAIKIAIHIAHQLKVGSVAFAPSILDTGIHPPANLNQIMLQAVKQEIDVYSYLYQKKLVKKLIIKDWIFDAGNHDFDLKVEQYSASFSQIFTVY